MARLWKITVAASLLALIGARSPSAIEVPPVPARAQAFDGSLSVLTYNVKGLPWPVALGRPAALKAIGMRLRALREEGKAPHVVVLQEAFTPEAQAMGVAAGYRYAVSGLGRDETASSPADLAFASGAHWWKGETEGKYVGSGLRVLSDYPIIAVWRMAFSTCAGFDCLANKGALLVTLAIPGAPSPVDVLTTHLNSRAASHVDDDRSIQAYRRQVSELTAFLHRNHDSRFPLIAAGDFNVGSAAPRWASLLGSVRRQWSVGAPVHDALRDFHRQGGALGADAAYSLKRARDWQFYADGSHGALTLAGIEVPFGRDRSGNMLSDHVGYVACFRLDATSSARSRS